MTSIRRAIATFSLVAILSTFVVSTAVAFNDVTTADGEVYTAVEALVANGAVTAGSTFGQTAPLTRGEAVKYLVVSAGGYTIEDPDTPHFTDVAKGSTYYTFVETAYKNGIVGGKTATLFAPNDTVTRAEFAKMAVLAFELPKTTPTAATFTDVPNTGVEYPFTFVETAAKYGVVKGMTATTFGPAMPITKSQGALMSYRAMGVDATEEEDEDDDTSADFDENGDTEGTINEVSLASADESEALEGEEEVEVYALDVELDDNGPLMLQRMDFYFGEGNTVKASPKPWDYFTEISIAVDGEIVATADVDTSTAWGTKDTEGPITTDVGTSDLAASQYRLRFTGLDTVLPSDETTKVTLLVSVKDSLDSDDEGATWWVEATELRVMDETGYVSTYSEGDAEMGDTDTDLEESFTMNETEKAVLETREGANSPEAAVIQVSKTADTNGVELYEFEIEETEGVDVNITQMTLLFTVKADLNGDTDVLDAGEDPAESTVLKKAYLLQDGEVVGTESMTADGKVVFDNLDIDVAGDTTEVFTVEVDIEDTNDAARYAEGMQVYVEVDTIDELTDAKDFDEDDITDLAVDLVSETFELRSEGVMFQYVSSTATATTPVEGASQQGEFTITFKATAFGADSHLADNVDCAALTYAVTGGTTPDAVCDLDSTTTDSEDGGGVFELDENTTRTFTASVVVTPDATGFYKVAISEFNWGGADGLTNTYAFDMGDYKTSSKSLTYVAPAP